MRLGIDIGGTKTHAVALDRAGVVLDEWRGLTGFGAADVVASAVTAVTELAARQRLAPSGFASIGIGIPGTVDTATGRVTHAVNLGVDTLELGATVGAQVGCAVRVENDVNAAALGAFHLLASAGMRSMAYLNLGTGVAAGLVLDGQLWRGSRGVAGEIGHIPVDPNGLDCPCGQRGCLETLASGSAIARLWPDASSPTAHALFTAADAGDAAARVAAERVIENIAAALRLLVLTVDVDAVVVGGGLSSLGDRLMVELRTRLAADAVRSPFLASLALPERVFLAPQDAPVAAIGAALVGERLIAAGEPTVPLTGAGSLAAASAHPTATPVAHVVAPIGHA